MIANRAAYSVSEWCFTTGIRKTMLYALWKEGTGPISVRVGRRRLVTESPTDYLHRVGERQYVPSPKIQGSAPPSEVQNSRARSDRCAMGDAREIAADADREVALKWAPSAKIAWQHPRGALVILTARWESPFKGSILDVTFPDRQP